MRFGFLILKEGFASGLTGFWVSGLVCWVMLSVYFFRPIGEVGKGGRRWFGKTESDRQTWVRGGGKM